MSALLELAEQCEAATGPDDALAAEIYIALFCRPKPEGYRWPAIDAPVGPAYPWLHPDGTPTNVEMLTGSKEYTASVDAALTLVPEGWRVRDLSNWGDTPTDAQWSLILKREGFERHVTQGEAATAALAICAAALRARAS